MRRTGERTDLGSEVMFVMFAIWYVDVVICCVWGGWLVSDPLGDSSL